MSSECNELPPPNLGMQEQPGSISRFHEDLTELDREAIDLENQISSTKIELESVNSLLLRYETHRSDLHHKLEDLEGRRKNCLMKRNALMATHDVFGEGGIGHQIYSPLPTSSHFTPPPESKSLLLSKLNGQIGGASPSPQSSIDMREPSDIQEMVSELFSTSINQVSPPVWPTDRTQNVFNTCFNLHDTLFKNNQHSSTSDNPQMSSNGHFSFEAAKSSSPSFCQVLLNSAQSNSPASMPSTPFSSRLPPVQITSFSAAVQQSPTLQQQPLHNNHRRPSESPPNSGSLSPASLEQNEVDVIDGASLPPTPSLSGSQSSSNSQLNSSTSQANGYSIQSSKKGAISTPKDKDKNSAYNSVIALETSQNGYVYKSLADKTVCRFKFSNPKDTKTFPGHLDKVKVLTIDVTHNLLFTGCDDGKVRCFNINSGSSLSEFQTEGSVVAIEKSWDNSLTIATNKGWVYVIKNQSSKPTVLYTHRTFNWISTLKPLLNSGNSLKNRKVLLVLPMKYKATLMDAEDGSIIRELDTQTIEAKPCVQVNGGIVILSTTTDKTSDPSAKSVISVFDALQNFNCIQRLKKDGVVSALRTHGMDLYVGVKFPSFGHIECFKWANKTLTLKWIACVAYVSCIAALPTDIVLNGGPDGGVYNTQPNTKGPFPCTNSKCKCKGPFARRKDLEFHYSKVSGTSPV